MELELPSGYVGYGGLVGVTESLPGVPDCDGPVGFWESLGGVYGGSVGSVGCSGSSPDRLDGVGFADDSPVGDT